MLVTIGPKFNTRMRTDTGMLLFQKANTRSAENTTSDIEGAISRAHTSEYVPANTTYWATPNTKPATFPYWHARLVLNRAVSYASTGAILSWTVYLCKYIVISLHASRWIYLESYHKRCDLENHTTKHKSPVQYDIGYVTMLKVNEMLK